MKFTNKSISPLKSSTRQLGKKGNRVESEIYTIKKLKGRETEKDWKKYRSSRSRF